MLPRLIRPAAYAWIVSNDHVLLCRLCEPHNMGMWTIPGGGLDFGENAKAGCLREVFEETGLTVQLGDLLTVDTVCGLVSPAGAVAESERLLAQPLPLGPAEMYSIRIVYLASVKEGTLTNECEGSTDCAEWIPLAEARKLPLVDLAATVLQEWEQKASAALP